MPIMFKRTKRKDVIVNRRQLTNARMGIPRRVSSRPTQELKGVDAGFAAVSTVAGNITLLNAIAAGDDINERNGRQIQLKYIDLYISVQMQLTTATARQAFVRYMVIYDVAPNGSLAVPGDILSATVSNFSPIRLDTRSRFTVLADVNVALAGNITTDLSNSNVVKHHRISLKNRTTQYTGTAAGIGTIRQGAIYLLIIGSDALNTVTMNSKTVYVDV